MKAATAKVNIEALAPALAPVPEVASQRPPLAAWIAYGAICLIWGTTFMGIRVAIETIPTLFVTGFRFLGAGLILLIVALATRARFPRSAREWRGQIVIGILMTAVANTTMVWAEHWISSGLTALLAATIPIWMAILESSFGLSRFTRGKLLGLALGFAGVGLLVAPAIGHPEVTIAFFLAVAAVQVSGISWNLGTLYSKTRPATVDQTAAAAIQMLTGGSIVTVIGIFTGAGNSGPYSMRSVMALVYLSLFGSVIAYSAYLYALSKLSAGKLSSYAYVNPAIAVVVGAIILGEAVTIEMLIAMAMILAGVAVIQLERSSARPHLHCVEKEK